MTAIEFLKSWRWLPPDRIRCGRPSSSELWRWLSKGSVIINGDKPKPKDEVQYPIKELIFFPKGRRVTIVQEACDG